MNAASAVGFLQHVHTSYLILGLLAGTMLALGVLFRIGVVSFVLRCLGFVVKASVQGGFSTWEYLLGWASWEQFVAIAGGLLLAGEFIGGPVPALRIVCSMALMIIGSSACIAYMFI